MKSGDKKGDKKGSALDIGHKSVSEKIKKTKR
jgi:hypothetical protein